MENLLSPEVLHLYSLWHIWKERKRNLIEKKCLPKDLCKHIRDYGGKIVKVFPRQTCISKEVKLIAWSPPCLGKTKLNIDGSVKIHQSGDATFGRLCIHNRGKWILGYSEVKRDLSQTSPQDYGASNKGYT